MILRQIILMEITDVFKTLELCTFDAMALMNKLKEEEKGYMVYNKKYPRMGADVPCDFESEMCRNAITAPPYDKDSDKPWYAENSDEPLKGCK